MWLSKLLRFQAPIQALPQLHPYTPLHLLTLEYLSSPKLDSPALHLSLLTRLPLSRLCFSLSLCLCYDILPLFKAQSKHLLCSPSLVQGPSRCPLITCNPPNVSAAHTLRSSPTRFDRFCLILFSVVFNSPLREKPYFTAFCLLCGTFTLSGLNRWNKLDCI